jgi:glycosyltransferase involved in cell wall biosynthesis
LRRWIGGSAARILATSQAVYDMVTQSGIPRARVRLVRNGIDPAPFDAVRDWPAGAPTVGMIGHFYPWKGHKDFLRMAQGVLRERPDARFLVAGEDILGENTAYRNEIFRMWQECGLERSVEFLGHCSDVAGVLSRIHLLVSLSRGEAFGRCIVEALAAGRPVAAWDDGGPAETLRGNDCGRLVPAFDEREFTRVVLSMLRDMDGLRRMGDRGRELARTAYHRSRMAAEVQAVYRELVS